jgi:hypothetical protein
LGYTGGTTKEVDNSLHIWSGVNNVDNARE